MLKLSVICETFVILQVCARQNATSDKVGHNWRKTSVVCHTLCETSVQYKYFTSCSICTWCRILLTRSQKQISKCSQIQRKKKALFWINLDVVFCTKYTPCIWAAGRWGLVEERQACLVGFFAQLDAERLSNSKNLKGFVSVLNWIGQFMVFRSVYTPQSLIWNLALISAGKPRLTASEAGEALQSRRVVSTLFPWGGISSQWSSRKALEKTKKSPRKAQEKLKKSPRRAWKKS